MSVAEVATLPKRSTSWAATTAFTGDPAASWTVVPAIQAARRRGIHWMATGGPAVTE